MNFRATTSIFCLLGALAVQPLQAQTTQPADYIVAVVNSEPITDSEIRAEIQRLRAEFAQSRQTLPPMDEMRKGVLERLILERAQLQLASEMGIQVNEASVDQTELAVARQNQIDVPELRRRLAKDGIPVSRFREQLRTQMILTRLREREVEGRLRITEQDIDRALAEEKARASDPALQELNIAQILIAVPENATAEVRAERAATAQKALAQLRAGTSFEKLVQEISAADKANGGELGLRRADRYPPVFTEAVQKLPVGGISDVVRSGAGLHILKVVERKAPVAQAKSTVQTRARHILLRVTPQTPAPANLAKLADFKKRVDARSADFQALAKEHSQDGSAAQGGDLGWAVAGMFVPEFEEVMGRLAEGQVSDPFMSRFGAHIIQIVERKRVELTPAEVREQVRGQLRESRYEEAYANWVRDVRGRAFVEMREPPL